MLLASFLQFIQLSYPFQTASYTWRGSDGYNSWRIVGQPVSRYILTRVVCTARLTIVFGALAAAKFNKS